MEVTRFRKFATGTQVLSDGYHVTLTDKDLDDTDQKFPFGKRMRVLNYRAEWALFQQCKDAGVLTPEEINGWGEQLVKVRTELFGAV